MGFFAIAYNVTAYPVLIYCCDATGGFLELWGDSLDWKLNAFQITSGTGNFILDPNNSEFHIPGMEVLLGKDEHSYAEALFAIPPRETHIPYGVYPFGVVPRFMRLRFRLS